ncbi:MAG: hypothetical protein OXN83_03675 [Oligoflexia bacterium]|nr:hypothetical protein [Oligoflexia bacterium]
MKTLNRFYLCLFHYSFYLAFVFSSFCFEAQSLDDIIFEIKRGVKEFERKQINKPKALEFQRKSFSYSDDFVILNKPPKSHLKSGTVLKVDFVFPFPPVNDEEIEALALVISPIKASLFGRVKAIKNSNQAVLTFNEIVFNDKVYSIETFPVFLKGKLKESFLKDIALGFFENIPVFISLGLSSANKALSQFLNKELKNETKEIAQKKKQIQNKNQKMKALEINQIGIIKVIVK